MTPLRPPHFREGSVEDRLAQVQLYLFRLVQELNVTLQLLEEQLRAEKDRLN